MRWLALALVAGCGPVVPGADDGGTTTGLENDENSPGTAPFTSGATTGLPMTTPVDTDITVTVTVGETGTTTTSSTTDDDADTATFITDASVGESGGCWPDCDPWLQDCCDGMSKCVAWANDGGAQWNSTRCVEVPDVAGAAGQACTVVGSGFSGVDDCEHGSMCWGVDDETLMGTCYTQCNGSEGDPQCPEGLVCYVGFDDVLALCVTPCDPLAPACAANEMCVFDSATSVSRCMPGALLPADAYAEPCGPISALQCGTGLVCASSSHVPGCDADCCTLLCDTTAPLECPDAVTGQTCLPMWRPGAAPEGLENLGFCGVP